MALSNAERQARFRARRDSLLKNVAKDYDLLADAVALLIQALKVEGRKNTQTISPQNIAVVAAILEQLVGRWPQLAPETKKMLANAKNPNAASLLLPKTKTAAPATPVTSPSCSFDHLVSTGENGCRDFQAQRLRGLTIDD
jgi:hypothetical protein